jgi:hypothetical protein
LTAPDNPNAEAAPGFRPEEPPPPPDLQTGIKPPPSSEIEKHRATTASKLAFWLLAILGGTMAVHYACLMVLILCKRDDGTKILEDAFHSWLPVLAGLAGGAVAYYFSKNGK